MKKIILWILVILLLIYIFFTKFDFLLFQVQICNKTNTNLYVLLKDKTEDFLLEYYSRNIIYGSYNSEKIIYYSMIKQWECSDYKNMHRLTYGFWIKGISYNYINWKKITQNEYSWWIWWNKKWKIWFWKHIYNIEKIEGIIGSDNWVLQIEVEK